MKSKPQIYAFHLLNDFSGSPKVLAQLLQAWQKEGFEVSIYTNNTKSGGFLSKVENVEFINGWYNYQSNPWLRLFYYTLSQFILFFNMFSKIKSTDIVYVNTMLPFGAGILGKLKGCRVIYHIHETSISPNILKWFLSKIIQWSANDIVYVSKYVAENHSFENKNTLLLYNAIDEFFFEKAKSCTKANNYSNLLMICSLKTYKGVFEFVKLAEILPEYRFKLVLNADKTSIDNFFRGTKIPINLEIYDSQSNLHPFFEWADMILNLSLPNAWVETFGLTIIEGMSYGLPSIVPTVGGIIEVIEHNKTGLAIDAREIQRVKEEVQKILGNKELYNSMSKRALERIEIFREKKFIEYSLQMIKRE
ncbi:MAG: hypothetical protein RLZZ546_1643 [Bacteroidota bacterium]|jgi:glycosyltransferase involved in cell wall biosynthesis